MYMEDVLTFFLDIPACERNIEWYNFYLCLCSIGAHYTWTEVTLQAFNLVRLIINIQSMQHLEKQGNNTVPWLRSILSARTYCWTVSLLRALQISLHVREGEDCNQRASISRKWALSLFFFLGSMPSRVVNLILKARPNAYQSLATSISADKTSCKSSMVNCFWSSSPAYNKVITLTKGSTCITACIRTRLTWGSLGYIDLRNVAFLQAKESFGSNGHLVCFNGHLVCFINQIRFL